MKRLPDFSGWATKYGLKCDDGRTIVQGAFKDHDGKKVPLIYNHDHGSLYSVLGHAILHSTQEGLYADCFLNDTEQGKLAREVVQHGDVAGLSIYANQSQESPSRDVYHANVRELSLVLSGANPGATIETVIGHDGFALDDELLITTVLDNGITINHSSDEKDEPAPKKEEPAPKKEDDSEETVGDVLNTLNDKQKKVVTALIGKALEEGSSGKSNPEEGEKKEMKHNVFDQDVQDAGVIEHSTFQSIMADAKRCGSFKEAFQNAVEDGVIAHTNAPIPTTGMTTASGHQTYGFNDADMLFPEYKSLNNPPEWIKRETGWVSIVMNGVHKTPFSRIKSVYANITENEARALGYIKGHLKKEEVFTTLKRTTDPQTIYKKQKLDRDDIIDITDFDVVAWIRAEMRVMLEEEIARAILIGDGRLGSSDDKIQENHVRPIATDVPLFNTQVKVTYDATDPDDDVVAQIRAKKLINSAIKARKNYKGSGNPIFFTTEDYLTEMLLLEDGIGHKLYKTEAELATALRVSRIVTVEVMEGQQITISASAYDLIGIMVNLSDYNVGADKGGEINNFDDFDIDYNQYKYLIETRISGALIKPFSALTFVDDPQT